MGSAPDFAQIVDALADAVTIRDPNDTIIYANRAALDDMGFASIAEMQSRAPGSIMDEYVVVDELGRELSMADIPSVRLLQGHRAEPLLMRTIHRETGEVKWKLLKASPLLDAAGALFATVTIIEDVTEVKTAELRSRFLAETSEMLASSLDYAQTLHNVAWSVVPRLADWCAVDLVDDSGIREPVVAAHNDPARRALAEPLRAHESPEFDPASGLGRVFASGRSELIAEMTDAILVEAAVNEEHLALMRELSLRSVLRVALRTPRRTLGVLTLAMSDSRRKFTAADVEFAEQLAARAGMAVENAMLYRARSQISETLQRGLLPERVPDIPGWDIATLYRSAGGEPEVEVGGDFYDFIELDDGWVVIIGDVTGKGLEAASLTSLARHSARFECRRNSRPSALLQAIDAAFVEHGTLSLCTALCLRIRDEEILLCSGGHPMPLVVGRDGTLRTVGQPGRLLGMPGAAEWRDQALDLSDGEVLTLYTDGVTDVRGPEERFGEDRLCDFLRGNAGATPDDLVTALDDALSRFGEGPQADDTAVVVLAHIATTAGPVRAARPATSRAAARSPVSEQRLVEP